MKFLSIDNTLINFDHIINMEYGISLQDDDWYGFYINVYYHGSDKPMYYKVGYSTDKEEWEKYVYRFSNEYDDISQLFTYKLNELLNDSDINIININTLESYVFNQIMEEDYQDIFFIKKAKRRNEKDILDKEKLTRDQLMNEVLKDAPEEFVSATEIILNGIWKDKNEYSLSELVYEINKLDTNA